MNKKMKAALLPLLSLTLLACGKTSDTNKETTKPTETTNETTRPAPVEDDKIHIIVLAGQSGARGKAHNSDLSDEDKEENYEVDILQSGMTMPQLVNIPETPGNASLIPVKPGLGDSANEFGPEIGMGKIMATRFPKDGATRKSVIVKYTACGSTFTDHWYSKSAIEDDAISSKLEMRQIREDKNGNATGPLTNNLYQLVDQSIETIKSEGYEPVIDGVVFCHGEQDSKFEKNMSIYETALKDFIKDFRDYYDMSSLPFVVTEAGTNASRYCNKLREIQKRVATEDKNCSFVSTSDLYSNTFEPWHFGAESNIILGQRMAEEIIALNDNRKIESFNLEESYPLPLNGEGKLPEYLSANFSNGTTGMVKVTYPDGVDDKSLGEKQVKVKASTNWGDFTAMMNVKVNNDPFIDGKTKDWTTKLHAINDKASVGFYTAENGLYVRGEIKDNEIYSDGEAWESGDMGQMANNDDLRIYFTTTDSKNAYAAFLSSDNLLRLYDSGTTNYIPSNNLYYKKIVTGCKSKVITTGEVNVPKGGKDCTGMMMELFIPYEELGISDPSSLKILAGYSDISKADEASKKTETVSYFNNLSGAGVEKQDSFYVALSELI